MKILVLGGTRYLGKTTAEILHNSGNEVITVSRSSVDDSPMKHMVCDRKDDLKLKTLIEEVAPDRILDMVCFDQGDGEGIARLHDLQSLNCIAHYLMISTFFLYNHSVKRETSFEGDISSIEDGYTKRKAEAETALHLSQVFEKTSILRLPFVFSHDDYSGRFQSFCDLSTSLPAHNFSDKFKMSMVSKQDAAKAISQIAIGRPLGYVDVANSGSLTQRKIASVINNATTKKLQNSRPEDSRSPYPLNSDLHLQSEKIDALDSLETALVREARLWEG